MFSLRLLLYSKVPECLQVIVGISRSLASCLLDQQLSCCPYMYRSLLLADDLHGNSGESGVDPLGMIMAKEQTFKLPSSSYDSLN